MVLDKIQQWNDIKKLTPEELQTLRREIRRFLIEKLSVTGGHLASNLGVVELTMALHLVCDFPKDKLIWDVGHQAYTHKLLTGRAPEFETQEHDKAWLLHVAANLSKNRLRYNRLRRADPLEETLIAQERPDLAFVWEAVSALPVRWCSR